MCCYCAWPVMCAHVHVCACLCLSAHASGKRAFVRVRVCICLCLSACSKQAFVCMCVGGWVGGIHLWLPSCSGQNQVMQASPMLLMVLLLIQALSAVQDQT